VKRENAVHHALVGGERIEHALRIDEAVAWERHAISAVMRHAGRDHPRQILWHAWARGRIDHVIDEAPGIIELRIAVLSESLGRRVHLLRQDLYMGHHTLSDYRLIGARQKMRSRGQRVFALLSVGSGARFAATCSLSPM
jgi:hypothetical protein